MDEKEDHYVKRDKSSSERQIAHFYSYVAPETKTMIV
jgi:hypothetical protein